MPDLEQRIAYLARNRIPSLPESAHDFPEFFKARRAELAQLIRTTLSSPSVSLAEPKTSHISTDVYPLSATIEEELAESEFDR